MNDATRKMRERDPRANVPSLLDRGEGRLPLPSASSTPIASKAQQVTRDLVARFLSPQSATEMLDPASLPALPSSPNRRVIAVLGTVVGILLGLAASRFRRPKLATA